MITLSLGDEPVDGAAAGAESDQGAMQDNSFDTNGNMTLDFGFFAPVSVGDVAFVDLDGDGLQIPGEPGIGGITVTLLDRDGNVVTTDAEGNPISGMTTTAADGSYLFDDLPPGEYAVIFDISTADNAEFYDFTVPDAGEDISDSDNTTLLTEDSAQSGLLPFLNSGEVNRSLDVGLICAVEVEVAEPFTICSTQPIDLTAGAVIEPASLGGSWSVPGDADGTFLDAGGNPTTDLTFGNAVAYRPGSDDAARGEVTLILTSNEPDGPCMAVSAEVTIQILKVDCGQLFWNGN